jgi:hypothetical protein
MKAINNELRDAQVGKYLRPENFTNKVWSMYLIFIREEVKESKTKTNKDGSPVTYSQNVYGFLDDKGEERILTGFLDDALWHAMEKADPEMGQLMDISAAEVIEGVYEWKIVLQKDIMDIGESAMDPQAQAEADGGLTAEQRAGKQVLEDAKNKPEEEEISLEDLPDIFQ